ncbi:MAG: heavy metal translocating P-type ATPase [Devosia sp.]
MTCCDAGSYALMHDAQGVETNDVALLSLSRTLGDGTRQIEFAVPDAHCAACIRSIETAVAALPNVVRARVNLSRRRVRIVFDPALAGASNIAPAIVAAGYHTHVLDPTADDAGDPVLAELVRAVAVAGFAAGNIMLFSVSVWAGADEATRALFHWISAIIALPAIVYSGRIFFRSAWRAVRSGHTNMDVPISIGVILATGLSLFETMTSGAHAYFDASATLLFFLLIGRTLDHLMRERARGAITNLARLQPRGAMRINPDGKREYMALDEIEPGMRLEIRSGERVPVDSVLLSDAAAFDYSIVTGESAPHALAQGETVMAGAAALTGPLEMQAMLPSRESYLSRMAELMEAAEHAKTRPRRVADRAASLYAPVVHALAITTFLGWGVASGDWHAALLNAVAVLIITCPCALALAVPIVHVVAAGRLFERGVLMKDGAALERIALADSVVFDKTGTLTTGQLRVVDHHVSGAEARGIAGALAAASLHPLSRAIATQFDQRSELGSIAEVAGQGVSGIQPGGAVWRLGRADWCGVDEPGEDKETTVWLTKDQHIAGYFRFEDSVRSHAAEAVRMLGEMNLPVRLVSGDLDGPVGKVANAVGIGDARARMLPADKTADVAVGRTLMVGDGINDAPALRAAFVSVAPSSAADIGRAAADFVFTGDRLDAVPFIVDIARRAASLVNQNLVIAIGYNAVAVPLAVSGYVTPLIAAIAMSSSSLIVVLNALRLRLDRRGRTPSTESPGQSLATETAFP